MSDLEGCARLQMANKCECRKKLIEAQDLAKEANAMRIGDLEDQVADLESWVDDLQSGMFINCVYCGHRYGPKGSMAATLPDAKSQSMADALTAHIAKCPKHPLSEAMRRIAELDRIIP